MTQEDLEDLKKDEWYLTRPNVIKEAIDKCPPIQLYKMKSSGKQCFIYSYEEPKNGLVEDVTVTVQKTKVGKHMTATQVFGVPLDDLEPWVD